MATSFNHCHHSKGQEGNSDDLTVWSPGKKCWKDVRDKAIGFVFMVSMAQVNQMKMKKADERLRAVCKFDKSHKWRRKGAKTACSTQEVALKHPWYIA